MVIVSYQKERHLFVRVRHREITIKSIVAAEISAMEALVFDPPCFYCCQRLQEYVYDCIRDKDKDYINSVLFSFANC